MTLITALGMTTTYLLTAVISESYCYLLLESTNPKKF